MRPRSRVGVVVAVAAGLGYGVSLVAARISYDHGVDFMTIVALRYLLVCIALTLFLILTKRTFKVPFPVASKSFLVGLIALTTSISYLASVSFIPVSLATLVFYTHPLVTVLLAAMFRGEGSSGWEIGATLAACLGLVLVLNVSFTGLHHWGLLLGIYASVSAAIVFVMSDAALTRIDPIRFTLCMALAGALVACVAMIAIDGVQLPKASEGWMWLIVSVGLNVAGLIAMFVSVSLIGPVSTPMILNIEPITAIGFAILLLGETMTLMQTLGAFVVLFAVLAAQLSRARRARQHL